MTEAEALDLAAKASWWGSWGAALRSANRGVIEALRAHAKTLMENAALKAEIEALKALRDDDGELLTIAWMDGAHRSNKARREQVAALKAEVERLRKMLKPQWFYYGEDQSSEQCRFSPYEVIDEDFFSWGERKKEGPHLVHISTAMPGPDIWAVVRVLTEEEMDARDDDEHWLIEEYDTEEEARTALERIGND